MYWSTHPAGGARFGSGACGLAENKLAGSAVNSFGLESDGARVERGWLHEKHSIGAHWRRTNLATPRALLHVLSDVCECWRAPDMSGRPQRR